jgi:PhnB protein
MASDTPPGMEFHSGGNITISLSGDDGDLLRGYFEKLSEGGQVTMPLKKQMWGDEFGSLTDRFGVSWLVNIASEGDA